MSRKRRAKGTRTEKYLKKNTVGLSPRPVVTGKRTRKKPGKKVQLIAKEKPLYL